MISENNNQGAYSSTTKQNLLIELYGDCNLQQAIKIISSKRRNVNSEDLFQTVFLFLSEMEERKIIELNSRGELFYFVLKVATNQFNTNNSLFYRQYLKSPVKEFLPELEQGDEPEITIKEKLKPMLPYINVYMKDNLHWYDKLIFEKYIQPGATYRSIAKEIGIPFSSIRDTIKKVSKLINDHIQKNNLYDRI